MHAQDNELYQVINGERTVDHDTDFSQQVNQWISCWILALAIYLYDHLRYPSLTNTNPIDYMHIHMNRTYDQPRLLKQHKLDNHTSDLLEQNICY